MGRVFFSKRRVMTRKVKNRNWKKPKKSDGITRDELRDLVLAGKNEDKHTEALEQLYQEEDAFLKQAEKDLNKALGMFPYKKMTYTLEDGLGLLRGRPSTVF